MQIIKKILIKQVITKNSKRALHRKFEHEIAQLKLECQQLLFEQRRLKKRFGAQKQEITERFQQEINQRKSKIASTEFKVQQLELLQIGSEIIDQEVNGLVDVAVGANWQEIISGYAVVIKDDVVIRIDKD